MSNIGTKRRKKIWRLLVVCCTFAILLSASTYAWFVGMKTVGVNTFDIDIATTEGLFLSMDGQSWSYSISPTDEDTPVYVNNANTFAPEGLIPMSSVGDMDVTSSRMKLYEKASLSAVPGGYKFLANQVNNYTTDNGHGEFIEGKGYVAFDLFIRNLSGNEYYEENNPLNEEAIYLLPESSVKVSLNGVENTGIEILGFTNRTYGCLKRCGIDTIDELISLSKIDFEKIPGLGPRGLEEIRLRIIAHDFYYDNEEMVIKDDEYSEDAENDEEYNEDYTDEKKEEIDEISLLKQVSSLENTYQEIMQEMLILKTQIEQLKNQLKSSRHL